MMKKRKGSWWWLVTGAFSIVLVGFLAGPPATADDDDDWRDIDPGQSCVDTIQEPGRWVLIALDHAGGDDDDDEEGERILTLIEIRLSEAPNPSGGIVLSPLIDRVLAEFETGNPDCGSPQVHQEGESQWVDWTVPEDALCFSVRASDDDDDEAWSEPQLVPLAGRTVEDVRAAIRDIVLGLD